MGQGELSPKEFEKFLKTSLGHTAAFSRSGAIVYVCMDWRHLQELLAAGHSVFAKLINICVWNKTNAGMGSLYRSQHELILVFKHGIARHKRKVLPMCPVRSATYVSGRSPPTSWPDFSNGICQKGRSLSRARDSGGLLEALQPVATCMEFQD
jgi:hypothetical protein